LVDLLNKIGGQFSVPARVRRWWVKPGNGHCLSQCGAQISYALFSCVLKNLISGVCCQSFVSLAGDRTDILECGLPVPIPGWHGRGEVSHELCFS